MRNEQFKRSPRLTELLSWYQSRKKSERTTVLNLFWQRMITPEILRHSALSLPEAEEQENWGEATFRVRGKIFMILSANGEESIVKASTEQQNFLRTISPQTFSKARYTGRYGWINVKLSTVDPGIMQNLIIEAWKRTAPLQLVSRYDASLK